MNFLKKLVFWLVSHKDTLTSWSGGILAFLVWFNDFLLTNNAFDLITLGKAFFTWLIAYLIGKNKFNISQPK